MPLQHAQTPDESPPHHQPFLNNLPPATSAVIPVFRQLTAVERDTFVAALQLGASREPNGRDIVERAKRLGQSSSTQTIYRALRRLTEFGYLNQSGPDGVERTYVPTRNGGRAYCHARRTEFGQD